jgi:hypothetical protein
MTRTRFRDERIIGILDEQGAGDVIVSARRLHGVSLEICYK